MCCHEPSSDPIIILVTVIVGLQGQQHVEPSLSAVVAGAPDMTSAAANAKHVSNNISAPDVMTAAAARTTAAPESDVTVEACAESSQPASANTQPSGKQQEGHPTPLISLLCDDSRLAQQSADASFVHRTPSGTQPGAESLPQGPSFDTAGAAVSMTPHGAPPAECQLADAQQDKAHVAEPQRSQPNAAVAADGSEVEDGRSAAAWKQQCQQAQQHCQELEQQLRSPL